MSACFAIPAMCRHLPGRTSLARPKVVGTTGQVCTSSCLVVSAVSPSISAISSLTSTAFLLNLHKSAQSIFQSLANSRLALFLVEQLYARLVWGRPDTRRKHTPKMVWMITRSRRPLGWWNCRFSKVRSPRAHCLTVASPPLAVFLDIDPSPRLSYTNCLYSLELFQC